MKIVVGKSLHTGLIFKMYYIGWELSLCSREIVAGYLLQVIEVECTANDELKLVYTHYSKAKIRYRRYPLLSHNVLPPSFSIVGPLTLGPDMMAASIYSWHCRITHLRSTPSHHPSLGLSHLHSSSLSLHLAIALTSGLCTVVHR